MRLGCWEITISASRRCNSSMIQSAANALSAIRIQRIRPCAEARACDQPGNPPWRWPGTRNRPDRPYHSAPESWSLHRRLSGLWPGFESPCCPLAVATDFDDGAVDHGLLPVRVFGDGIEDPSEDIALDPGKREGVPVAEDFG